MWYMCGRNVVYVCIICCICMVIYLLSFLCCVSSLRFLIAYCDGSSGSDLKVKITMCCSFSIIDRHRESKLFTSESSYHHKGFPPNLLAGSQTPFHGVSISLEEPSFTCSGVQRTNVLYGRQVRGKLGPVVGRG